MVIRYESELYHYGIKGMRWGVRRSPEVRSVNKEYKKELKVLDKEAKKVRRSNTIKRLKREALLGESYAQYRSIIDNHENRKNYKQKKKALQEKYEPDFKKAQAKAEKRLSAEPKKISNGKKVAAGILAGLGTATVATLAVDVARNKEVYSSFIRSVPTILTRKI